MRRLVLVFCLLAVTACAGKSPAGPTVPRDARFTLAPGQTATLEGTGISVEFVTVIGDSRCPGDALCIRLGEAIVQLRVNDNGLFTAYQVDTGSPEHRIAMHRDLRIELVDVQPYPFSNRRIQPSDYRATLTTR